MDTSSDEADFTCPICAEEMDLTDRRFQPCQCGYQICLWCWHQIMELAGKNGVEGRCPACRTTYDKEKITSAAPEPDELPDSFSDKKQKNGKGKNRATDARKHLSNVRVVQRNLVYVVGLPLSIADEEILERKEYFGQYGKILKIAVSRQSAYNAPHSNNGPTASVYVSYVREEDALKSIQAVDGCMLEGKVLKASFGTTKYCNFWLKNLPCNNPECLYLHDIGTQEDSFTKEDMIAKYGSKHQSFLNITHPGVQQRAGVGFPPPPPEVLAPPVVSSATHSTSPNIQPHVLAVPPSAATASSAQKLQTAAVVTARSSGLPPAASWASRGSIVSKSQPPPTKLLLQASSKQPTAPVPISTPPYASVVNSSGSPSSIGILEAHPAYRPSATVLSSRTIPAASQAPPLLPSAHIQRGMGGLSGNYMSYAAAGVVSPKPAATDTSSSVWPSSWESSPSSLNSSPPPANGRRFRQVIPKRVERPSEVSESPALTQGFQVLSEMASSVTSKDYLKSGQGSSSLYRTEQTPVLSEGEGLTVKSSNSSSQKALGSQADQQVPNNVGSQGHILNGTGSQATLYQNDARSEHGTETKSVPEESGRHIGEQNGSLRPVQGGIRSGLKDSLVYQGDQFVSGVVTSSVTTDGGSDAAHNDENLNKVLRLEVTGGDVHVHPNDSVKNGKMVEKADAHVIADILGLDFDVWSDSSLGITSELENLFLSGANSKVESGAIRGGGLMRSAAPATQSRFRFARDEHFQGDSGGKNESTNPVFTPTNSVRESSQVQPRPAGEAGVHLSAGGYEVQGAKTLPLMESKYAELAQADNNPIGKLLAKISPVLPAAAAAPASSAGFTAPPGFALPATASVIQPSVATSTPAGLAVPPGFGSSSAGAVLSSTQELAKPALIRPFSTSSVTDSSGSHDADLGFVDPAIMAVGRAAYSTAEPEGIPSPGLNGSRLGHLFGPHRFPHRTSGQPFSAGHKDLYSYPSNLDSSQTGFVNNQLLSKRLPGFPMSAFPPPSTTDMGGPFFGFAPSAQSGMLGIDQSMLSREPFFPASPPDGRMVSPHSSNRTGQGFYALSSAVQNEQMKHDSPVWGVIQGGGIGNVRPGLSGDAPLPQPLMVTQFDNSVLKAGGEMTGVSLKEWQYGSGPSDGDSTSMSGSGIGSVTGGHTAGHKNRVTRDDVLKLPSDLLEGVGGLGGEQGGPAVSQAAQAENSLQDFGWENEGRHGQAESKEMTLEQKKAVRKREKKLRRERERLEKAAAQKEPKPAKDREYPAGASPVKVHNVGDSVDEKDVAAASEKELESRRLMGSDVVVEGVINAAGESASGDEPASAEAPPDEVAIESKGGDCNLVCDMEQGPERASVLLSEGKVKEDEVGADAKYSFRGETIQPSAQLAPHNSSDLSSALQSSVSGVSLGEGDKNKTGALSTGKLDFSSYLQDKSKGISSCPIAVPGDKSEWGKQGWFESAAAAAEARYAKEGPFKFTGDLRSRPGYIPEHLLLQQEDLQGSGLSEQELDLGPSMSSILQYQLELEAMNEDGGGKRSKSTNDIHGSASIPDLFPPAVARAAAKVFRVTPGKVQSDVPFKDQVDTLVLAMRESMPRGGTSYTPGYLEGVQSSHMGKSMSAGPDKPWGFPGEPAECRHGSDSFFKHSPNLSQVECLEREVASAREIEKVLENRLMEVKEWIVQDNQLLEGMAASTIGSAKAAQSTAEKVLSRLGSRMGNVS